jgi:hypothetical protein
MPTSPPPGPERSGFTTTVVCGWILSVLWLDRGAAPGLQVVLGLASWALLAVLLRGCPALVRVQVAVVVVFATAVEYTFSGWLGVYVYRLDNVPAFVPPGHGLVYLGALALGRSAPLVRHATVLTAATVVGGGAYAAWGLWLSPRPDALGAFWYLCLLGFLRWGPSRTLYVGAAVVVTYLELLGTALGTWTWRPHDPTGLVSIGNPPSGAAGGYGWFDLAALLAAPGLLARARAFPARFPAALRPRRPGPRPTGPPRSATVVPAWCGCVPDETPRCVPPCPSGGRSANR